MAHLRVIAQRLAGVVFRRRMDRDLREEIQSHIDMETAENLRRGLEPREARKAALRRFGGVDKITETYRDRRGLPLLETTLQDLRYGARTLRKNPGFAFVAVIALALGIGATAAIFSVANAVLMRPLPFDKPERLMTIASVRRGKITGAASYPDFVDWKAQSNSYERMAAYIAGDYILTGQDEPLRLQGATIDADLLPLLGASPGLGRGFAPDEDKPGASARVVILSHSLWRRRFNSDPNILGSPIALNGAAYSVIGVMPEGFQFPVQNQPVELWTARYDPDMAGSRGAHYLRVIARLKPGVSQAQAQSEMSVIAGRLEEQYPDTNTAASAKVEPVLETLVGDVRPALIVLIGAVACLLLIACANVANLLLARATTRHREMAIRAALGAGRARVVRQLLTESLLLATIGGAIGLALAAAGLRLLVGLTGEDLPRSGQIRIDAVALGFTLLISLLTGLLFGILPAAHSGKDLAENLKEGGRGSTEGARRNRLRGVLVVAEVAIAIVLLSSAGLLIQSLRNLQQVPPGFNPQNVLSFTVGVSDAKYNTVQQARFFRDLIARMKLLPGVRSASGVYPLPLSTDRVGVTFETEGRPMAKGDLPSSEYRAVGVDYFRTMGIPVLKGRDFTAQDDNGSVPVIVVNELFAQRFFAGEDPIGKHIKPGISVDDSKPAMREIVGVVGNIKWKSLSADVTPEYYVPESQVPLDTMAIVVRTENDPRSIAGAIRGEVSSLDKDVPAYDVRTLQEYVEKSVAQPRLNTLLLVIFAGIAMVLTAIGLNGVISYSVTQRTHEIGVRVALGARRGDVLSMVVRQGMTLTAIGIGLGLAGAFALTRLMTSLLYGVSATDPVTFLLISILLSAVALLACIVPARRATRVDPIVALRYE
jgi:predicted permease